MNVNPQRSISWKRQVVWVALAVSLVGRADYRATLRSLAPVAYYAFDEAGPSPALNTVTSSTGLGAAGTGYVIQSVDGVDARKGEPGMVGTSVRFFNTANAVGYSGSKIDVPFTPALNPEPPFTVEFWAKPNTLGGDSFSPLANLNPYFTLANRSGWIFYEVGPGGSWQFQVGGENSYTSSPISVNGTAAAGRWSHVVGVFDGSSARLYVDGALAATAPASASAPFASNQWIALRIGSTALAGIDGVNDGTWSEPYGNRQFDGWVDEVALYGSALSDAQIAAHFGAGNTNKAGYAALIQQDNPIAYWNLDEPAFTPPGPETFPGAANLGSAGSAADGKIAYGTLAGQPGVPYSGLPSGNRSVFFSGDNGNFAVGDPTIVPPALNIQGKVTLAAWVRPLQRDANREILVHGNWATGAATFLRIGNADATLNAAFYEVGTSDGQNPDVCARMQIPDGDLGNWVHLVGTYDGEQWNLYRNGLLAAQTPDNAGALEITDFNWSVGADSSPNPGAGLAFGGWIDEPAVFDTPLSAAEVLTLYRSANVPPVITRGLAAPSSPVYEGTPIVLSVWAEGNPDLRYQWFKDHVPISGQTATNLDLGLATVAGSGTYSVVVSNSFGSATSGATLTVVASAPVITKAPASLTRWEGVPFLFSVAALGTGPISYEWRKGGQPVATGLAASYSGTASAATEGTYSVVLSNPVGSMESTGAKLTVLPAPTGYGSAVLSDKPLAYFRLDETQGTVAHDYVAGLDGTYSKVKLGQTGSSGLDKDGAAAFSGVDSYVGSIPGAAFDFHGSNNLTFSIEAWVSGLANQAEGATIMAKGTGGSGGSANEQFALDISGGVFRFFTRTPDDTLTEATASGGPDSAWHHLVGVYDGPGGNLLLYVDGELSGSASVPAAGVRASTFAVSIGSKRSGVDPEYDQTFDGSIDEVAFYGTALSSERVLAHFGAAYGSGVAPSITGAPADLTSFTGLPAVLRVHAVGSVPFTHQWSKDGAEISGATSSTISFAALAGKDAGKYTVTIRNGAGFMTSDPVTLKVLEAPTQAVPIPGLVLHLPFDTNLTDATGRGNNGSKVGNPEFVTDGALGSALHYSTDTSGTNYVTLGVRPDLNFGSKVSFTVSFWARLPLNYTGGDLPFFTDAKGSTFAKGFVFAPSYGFDALGDPASPGHIDGAWAFSVLDASFGGAGVGGHGPIGSLNDGGWHHLVYVLDRNGPSTVYLDGVPSPLTKEQGTAFSAAGDISTGAAATIGQDPTGAYGEFGSADIDDLGVWRRALTPYEAASIYVAGSRSKVSFVDGSVTLHTEVTADRQLKLTWSSGTLQASDAVSGVYQDVSASSPHTVLLNGQTRFFRVKL